MNWELERLARLLAKTLAELSHQIESVTQYRQAENDSTKDKSFEPVGIKIVQTSELDPTRREYYESENKDRKSFWRKIKPWVETVGIATAVAIGILNWRTLHEVSKQTSIAENQNRPWIKIVDVVLIDPTNDSPALSFITMPLVQRDGRQITQAGATINLEITVKNIGKGVARNVYVVPVFTFYKVKSTEILGRTEDKVCRQTMEWNPGAPFAWTSIFPDETRKWNFATVGYYDGEMVFHPPDRPGTWLSGILFGCVTYQPSSDYLTSAVFEVLGEKDRFFEVGRPLNSKQLRLLRDEHFEYAQ